jgi:hypothetical protein
VARVKSEPAKDITRLFMAWCQQHGYSDVPPVAPALVAWLTERAAAGSSQSTLTVALAAIKAGHKAAGQRFDGADPDLQRALAGARREAVREPRQATPLRAAILGGVLASLGDGDLDRRDAAMLALYMLALRRSELVEIDLEVHGDGLAVLRMTDQVGGGGLVTTPPRPTTRLPRIVIESASRKKPRRGVVKKFAHTALLYSPYLQVQAWRRMRWQCHGSSGTLSY